MEDKRDDRMRIVLFTPPTVAGPNSLATYKGVGAYDV